MAIVVPNGSQGLPSKKAILRSLSSNALAPYKWRTPLFLDIYQQILPLEGHYDEFIVHKDLDNGISFMSPSDSLFPSIPSIKNSLSWRIINGHCAVQYGKISHDTQLRFSGDRSGPRR